MLFLLFINSVYSSNNYDQKLLDIFLKFLVIITPVFGGILIYFIWKLTFYFLVKKHIRQNNLDISYIRESNNIFLNGYMLYKILQNINNQEELRDLIDDYEIQRVNPYNFPVNNDENDTNQLLENDTNQLLENDTNQLLENDTIQFTDNLSINSNNSINDYDICVICLENINSKIFTKLYCSHKFHIECLNNWIKKSNKCPLCNRNILNNHEQILS